MNLRIRIGKTVPSRLPQTPFRESGLGRIAGIAMFSVIALLAGIRFYRLRYFGESVDEGDNLAIGWLLTQELKIYDSVFSHHTPLAYISTHIVAILSPSDDFTHFRVIPWFFLVLTGLSFLISPLRLPLLLKALSSTLFMFFVAILAPLWLGHMVLMDGLWGYLFVCFGNVFLLPAALGHLEPGQRSKYFLLGGGGLLVGWVSGSLITLYPFLIVLLLTPLILRGNKIDCRTSLKHLTRGIVLTAVFYLFWLLSFGSVQGFFEQAIVFNLKAYSQFTEYSEGLTGAIFGPSIVKVLRNHLYWLFVSENYIDRICECLLLLGLFTFGCFVYFHERRSVWCSAALVACSFILLSALRLRSGAYHAAPYYLGAVSLFAWSIGLALSTRRLMIAIPVIAVVSLLGFDAVHQVHRYVPFSWNESSHSNAIVPSEPTFHSGLKMAGLQPTFQYIIENTSPPEKIAAFPTLPIIYLKTKRLPAHSGVYYYPWNAKWEENKGSTTTCNEVKHAMPKFIWLDRWKVWDRYEFGEFAKCLNEFITTNYRYVDRAKFPHLLHRNASSG
mgnify:CR=1 FL=1